MDCGFSSVTSLIDLVPSMGFKMEIRLETGARRMEVEVTASSEGFSGSFDGRLFLWYESICSRESGSTFASNSVGNTKISSGDFGGAGGPSSGDSSA